MFKDGRNSNGEPIKVAVGEYNFHTLRHAAASMLIEAGLNPKKVQAVMGHSSITVTYDTYGHLFADDEADQRAVKSIEDRIFG